MVFFAFFGTSNNSIIVLDRLLNAGYGCTAVITIPDRPIGRKQILTPSPVKIFAQKRHIPVFTANNKDKLLIVNSQLSIRNSQFGVVADFGFLIPGELISAFPRGILNLHPSLLPAYQGATPAPFQILRGKKEGGITIITINEEFDKGDIVGQEKFPISESETTESLLVKGFTTGANLLITVLPDYLGGKIKPIPQNLSHKSYFPRLTRDDGFISWSVLRKAMEGKEIEESEKPRFLEIGKLSIINYQLSIERAIRALSPWPGIWTMVEIKGQYKRLKLLKSHIEKGKLVLDEVQLEGKNPVSWGQFLKACQITNKNRLKH
jgi:methionyl-tRNA formyltransferase